MRTSLMVLLTAASLAMPAAAKRLSYPPSPTVEAADTIAGQRVPDPWRWLENDVRQDAQVRAWVEAQNQLTMSYLAGLPQREAIEARLRALWNFERFGVPVREGGRYFFLRNSGLQNQSVLLVQEGLSGTPRVLIDPNRWAEDGATALAEWRPSPDGRWLAYAVQDGGSDWRTVRVLEVATGRTVGDALRWVKFSGLAWKKDSSGFFYARFPAPPEGQEFQSPNLNQSVWFHRLGTPQSADRLVWATPDRPQLGHGAQVSDDGRWLVITTWQGTDDRYEISVLDLRRRGARPRTLIAGLEHSWALAGVDGRRLLFTTNKDAPRYRVVSIDPARGLASLREVVPQGPGVIQGAQRIGKRLIVTSLEDAKSAVRSFDLKGGDMREVALPGIGSVAGFDGDGDSSETFFAFSSFNYPTTIFRLDSASGQVSEFKRPNVPFDPTRYEVRQEFYRSRDGTRVPMFIVRAKDQPPGPQPTLLFGYGGFNISLTPAFSVARLAWMEMGGTFALANIRGGGEYGKDWHDAGKLLNKQNVFDDFIAAAEHLVASGVTTPQQLAIQGGSNGGLLVGAVVNQRPDLFAAALPAVGVMDMLRYNQFTAGRYWVDDYGDPNDPRFFPKLRAYSPYHNIRDGRDYPAILVTTADTDDRVVPGHSFKYAAALQAAQLGDRPHLIRIETRAGHGAGKPTDKLIEEAADLWAFAGYWTGLTRAPARPVTAGSGAGPGAGPGARPDAGSGARPGAGRGTATGPSR
jgi:prolyl oligopeptidase